MQEIRITMDMLSKWGEKERTYFLGEGEPLEKD